MRQYGYESAVGSIEKVRLANQNTSRVYGKPYIHVNQGFSVTIPTSRFHMPPASAK
jgi:hypothetical protein